MPPMLRCMYGARTRSRHCQIQRAPIIRRHDAIVTNWRAKRSHRRPRPCTTARSKQCAGRRGLLLLMCRPARGTGVFADVSSAAVPRPTRLIPTTHFFCSLSLEKTGCLSVSLSSVPKVNPRRCLLHSTEEEIDRRDVGLFVYM